MLHADETWHRRGDAGERAGGEGAARRPEVGDPAEPPRTYSLVESGEPQFHELEPHPRMARAARATAKGGLSGLMFVPRPARVNVSAAVSQSPVLT